ncbi:MAG: hypothetical protein HQL69_08785 [Magnetococcales bacterium]|nr:hypothetical protein [Magnetococcales bacterium]
MELTIVQKVIGGIVLVVFIGFAISLALDDLDKNRAAINQNKAAIEEPMLPESVKE